MALLITAGVALQRWSVAWGLVLTELVVILIPTLVFVTTRQLSPQAVLRLRAPGWDLILLSVPIGVGLWFFDATVDSLVVQLLGYAVDAPQTGAMTVWDAVGTLLGLGLLAPLCEEVLFRGLVQRAYERRGVTKGILVGGLLFGLYHLRLQGLPAVLPIAMILGYSYWRSQSLLVPVVIHMSNNVLGALSAITQGLRPTTNLGPIFVIGLGPALLVGAVALWLFHRRTRHLSRPLPLPERNPSAWQMVPLVLAAGIYVVFGFLELAYNRFPGLIARDELPLTSAPWTETTAWHYDLRLQVTGERVGGARCEVTPDGAWVTLVCEIEQDAFDVQQGRSRWVGGELTQATITSWSAETLLLETAQITVDLPDETLRVDVSRSDEGLVLTTGAEDRVVVPIDALLIGGGGSVVLAAETPWRLSALDFRPGLVIRITVVEPLRWQDDIERPAPEVGRSYVVVEGRETLSLPGGTIEAWRVSLAEDRTAWYAVTAPHPLLRYDTGILRWEWVPQDG